VDRLLGGENRDKVAITQTGNNVNRRRLGKVDVTFHTGHQTPTK